MGLCIDFVCRFKISVAFKDTPEVISAHERLAECPDYTLHFLNFVETDHVKIEKKTNNVSTRTEPEQQITHFELDCIWSGWSCSCKCASTVLPTVASNISEIIGTWDDWDDISDIDPDDQSYQQSYPDDPVGSPTTNWEWSEKKTMHRQPSLYLRTNDHWKQNSCRNLWLLRKWFRHRICKCQAWEKNAGILEPTECQATSCRADELNHFLSEESSQLMCAPEVFWVSFWVQITPSPNRQNPHSNSETSILVLL